MDSPAFVEPPPGRSALKLSKPDVPFLPGASHLPSRNDPL